MKVICCPTCGELLPAQANFCASCGDPPNQPIVKFVQSFVHERVPVGVSSQGSIQPDSTASVPLEQDVPTTQGLPIENNNSQLTLMDWQEGEEWQPLQSLASTVQAPTQNTPLPQLPLHSTQLSQKPSYSRTRPWVAWLTLLLIAALITSAIAGIIAWQQGLFTPLLPGRDISLHVTPANVNLGGVITLHGTNFSPNGHVGLTRDLNIPLPDVHGQDVVKADNTGSFTGRVTTLPNWQPGSHIIRADDALSHKTASFTVITTGQGTALRAPRLALSLSTIDFGSADQAMNGIQLLSLSNAGDGQISWQTSATQPWLMLSPKGGTFTQGQKIQVAVAVQRVNVNPGSYIAGVNFMSNVGQVTLPVKMQVTQLQPGNHAVLQPTPPVFSFTGTDGGSSPLPQQNMSLSNPGVQPLQWSTSSEKGNTWLSISHQAGSISQGGNQYVSIHTNMNALLPGVYGEFVTLSGQPSIIDSPQRIYVSLTIIPQCGLQVSPGALSFNSAISQPGPAPQTINIGSVQTCHSSINWNASVNTGKDSPWINVSTSSGMTPATPSVSVNVAGLIPRTYIGSVILSSKMGTQTLPVTLTIAPSQSALLAVNSTNLSFTGMLGQADPAAQTVTIMNQGVDTMRWQANAPTPDGTAWLHVGTQMGTLAGGQSTPEPILVSMAGLTSGKYTGSISISAMDARTHQSIGTQVAVTLMARLSPTPTPSPVACTLQSPSSTQETFRAPGSQKTQSFTIGTNAGCASNITISPTASTGNGGNWLAVSSNSPTVTGGGNTTFTVNVTSSGLATGSYAGTISLAAINGSAIAGSPQIVKVSLIVRKIKNTLPPPALMVSPPSLPFSLSQATGTSSQPITITNTGGGPLNWQASVAADAGLTLSSTSGSLDGGGSDTVMVTADPAMLTIGSLMTTITINATDSAGNAVGNPQLVTVKLSVAA